MLLLHGGLEGLWGILFEQLPGFIVQLVSILIVSIFYNKMLGLVMALYLVVFIILALSLSRKRKIKRSAYREARSEYTGKVADILPISLLLKQNQPVTLK
jgi:c-di-AMP phosphodiesterase-like protein